jgi:putative acetyltransferase
MSQQQIEIRRTVPDDYPALCAIFSQPKAIRGTLQMPFPSPALWKKRLAEPDDGLYSLVACVGGAVVGSLGLSTSQRSPRRRHAADVGMAVHDDWHGRGVGSALLHAAIDLADNWLNLTRLELTVFTDNERAIALYERRGFVVEGRLRDYAFRDGELVDAYAMARLHETPSRPGDDR